MGLAFEITSLHHGAQVARGTGAFGLGIPENQVPDEIRSLTPTA